MEQKKKMTYWGVGAVVLALAVICLCLFLGTKEPMESFGDAESVTFTVSYGSACGETFSDESAEEEFSLPEELLELLARNPETEEFVKSYPYLKDQPPVCLLEEEAQGDTVPLLMQWDTRWGYMTYGDGMMGLTGCGPTCLSMVCLYLLRDPSLTPAAIANFSIAAGYCVPGSGSAWALISGGGKTLGLTVTELPLSESAVKRSLEAGHPVICIMGPGDFTTSGHFIVLTEYSDGVVKVNDPNSYANSERLWSFEQISGQIKNLWECRA